MSLRAQSILAAARHNGDELGQVQRLLDEAAHAEKRAARAEEEKSYTVLELHRRTEHTAAQAQHEYQLSLQRRRAIERLEAKCEESSRQCASLRA